MNNEGCPSYNHTSYILPGIGILRKMKDVSATLKLFIYSWPRNSMKNEGHPSYNHTFYILTQEFYGTGVCGIDCMVHPTPHFYRQMPAVPPPHPSLLSADAGPPTPSPKDVSSWLPSGGQRGVEKSVSYLAGFVVQGQELRIPTNTRVEGKMKYISFLTQEFYGNMKYILGLRVALGERRPGFFFLGPAAAQKQSPRNIPATRNDPAAPWAGFERFVGSFLLPSRPPFRWVADPVQIAMVQQLAGQADSCAFQADSVPCQANARDLEKIQVTRLRPHSCEGPLSNNNTFFFTYFGHINSMKSEGRLSYNNVVYIRLGILII